MDAAVLSRAVTPLRILGIDPGRVCGLALIEIGRGGRASLFGFESSTAPAKSTLFRDELDCIDIVAIEHVAVVYPRERFSARMATAIAHASHQAGMLRGLAECSGLRVVEVTAAEWRRAIVGKSNASDAEIKRVITAAIVDWPARSNAHVRDAAGVAIYAAKHHALIARTA